MEASLFTQYKLKKPLILLKGEVSRKRIPTREKVC